MRFIFFLFILVNCAFFVSAQSMKELNAKKKKNLEDIELTKVLLSETKSKRKRTVNDLYLINRQVELRQNIISNIDNEVENLNYRIDTIDLRIFELEKELVLIKDEYSKVIQNTYKHRDENSLILFILSASSFNQAYKRIKYFQQYSNYREQQKKKILLTQEDLRRNKILFDSIIVSKQKLKDEKVLESDRLTSEVLKQKGYLSALKKEEKKLRQSFLRQQRVAKELQKAIAKLVASEFKKDDKGRSVFQMTPAEKLVSTEFVKNKGRLPWPTERGIIVKRFGKHKHPLYKHVTLNSIGIDIATPVNSYAKAIFTGEVTDVVVIPGSHLAVLVKHGDYFSVYQNLSQVNVKVGDKISTKDNIGKIYFEKSENAGILHFQIWHEKIILNPSNWIKAN